MPLALMRPNHKLVGDPDKPIGDDPSAVLWSYRDFRNAHPDVDTHAASEVAGYQILKANQTRSAIALVERNAADYPDSATSAFGLGRAYKAAGELAAARAQFERAVKLDPNDARARDALANLIKGAQDRATAKVQ
jgi:tetratricopeptide (TPR) repeat protein